MSISSKLREYLDGQGVEYSERAHEPAYTAQEVAAAEHVPGRELAKSVILKADDRLIMAVLPASYVVNLGILKDEIGCDFLRLASEEEFRDTFPSCEVGAMPPFGNIFGVEVYCDSLIESEEEIEFNAGTHTDTVRLKSEDFKRLVNPHIASFREQWTGQGAAAP